jgi:hypothetical protein
MRSRPNGSQSAWGACQEQVPRKSCVPAAGIDMGKTTLHMVGPNSHGGIVLREKVSCGRWANFRPEQLTTVLKMLDAVDV